LKKNKKNPLFVGIFVESYTFQYASCENNAILFNIYVQNGATHCVNGRKMRTNLSGRLNVAAI